MICLYHHSLRGSTLQLYRSERLSSLVSYQGAPKK